MQSACCEPAKSQEASPSLLKYNVFGLGGLAGEHKVPNVIWYWVDVAMHLGVARRSAMTPVMMLLALVREVASRFVCTPMGSKPKSATKQKAVIPRANVTSTSENADVFIAYRFLRCYQFR
jgi:hypothetical protein